MYYAILVNRCRKADVKISYYIVRIKQIINFKDSETAINIFLNKPII